jgi:hypothetical protein
MAFIYDLSDTWNNAGISFNGIKLNATDTASASGSKLIDLQINGASKFTVGKTGNVIATGLIESTVGGFRFPDGTTQTTKATVNSVSGTGTVNGITLTGSVTDSGSLTLGGTLGNIANNQLTNSAITINGTSTPLGGSIAVGTVTSVAGTGTVNGLTLTGSVTTSGSLTLGGTLGNISNSQLTNSAITINGTSTALGGSISVGTVTSVAALTLGTSGTDLASSVANGTTTPVITLNVPTASAANRGALSPSDWSTFNAKQAALVSGTNIKTVGGASLLGSGDVGTIGLAYGGTGATTESGARTALGLGTAAVLNAGVAGGVATLDGSGTVPTSQLPGAVLGGLNYQGTWNASTNVPTLASSTGSKGYYYVVSTAGSTNLNGITDWKIGDWAVYDGTAWQKVDNTDAVSSVNGYTGAVVLTTSDVAQGTNLYFTQAAARDSVSAGTGISYNSTTGVITNSAPDQTVALTGAGTTTITGTYPNFTITSNDSTVGTVTSVAASGGTTGLTFTGSPITTAGTLTLGGTLAVANGGTGATTLTSGYVLKGNGTSAVSASVLYDDGTNIGIGTTSPSALFHISKNGGGDIGALVSQTNGGNGTTARYRATHGSGAAFNLQAGNGHVDLNVTSNHHLTFGTNNAERIRITATGDIGIGTSSVTPYFGTTAKIYNAGNGGTLQVAGSSVTGTFWASEVLGLTSVEATTNHPLMFGTNSTERMRITSAGDVGIGTATPVSRLNVSGTTGFTWPDGGGTSSGLVTIGTQGTGGSLFINTASLNTGFASGLAIDGTYSHPSSVVNIKAVGVKSGGDYNSSLAFHTSFETTLSEKMRILSGGNVGVGTSSPATKFVVSNGGAGGLEFDTNGLMQSYNRSTSAYQFMYLDAAQILFRPSGTERMRLDGSGVLLINRSSTSGLGKLNVDGGADFTGGNVYLARDTGNVGIGTGTLGNKLSVAGGQINTVADEAYGIALNATTGNVRVIPYAAAYSGSVLVSYSAGYAGYGPFTVDAANIRLWTAGNERMRIDASGNLGLGTSSPSQKLEVSNGAAQFNGGGIDGTLANAILFGNTTYPTVQKHRIRSSISAGSSVDNKLSLEAGTATTGVFNDNQLVLRGDGNVGIGTGSPSQRLDVSFEDTTTNRTSPINVAAITATSQANGGAPYTGFGPALVFRSESYDGTTYNGPRVRMAINDDSIATTAGSSLAFDVTATKGAAPTEAMIIDPSGRVGIGTNTPGLYPFGGLLNVAGGISMALDNRIGWGITDSFTLNGVGTAHYGFTYGGGTNLVTTSGYYGVNFATLGSERMRITSGGNVGIGTTSVAARLHSVSTTGFVEPTLLCGNGVGTFRIVFQNGAYAGVPANKPWLHSYDDIYIGSDAVTSFNVISGGGNVFNVSGSGNATITGTGNGTLTIGSFAGAYSSVLNMNSSAGGGSAITASQFLGVHTAGTERMRITAVGNLGVGTSSPTDFTPFGFGPTIETKGGHGGSFIVTNGDGTLKTVLSNNVSQTAGFLKTLANHPLAFGTNDTERARFDTSGNLLVGCTSTAFASGQNTGIYLTNTTGGTGGLHIKNTANNTGTNVVTFYGWNDTQTGSILTYVNVTNYNTSSDVRLKENIADADDTASLIDAIKVRKFDWKSDGSHQRYGMVAQELVEVAPEAVSQQADPEDMMGVDYSKLVPMLVKELQSLRARVAQLEGN